MKTIIEELRKAYAKNELAVKVEELEKQLNEAQFTISSLQNDIRLVELDREYILKELNEAKKVIASLKTEYCEEVNKRYILAKKLSKVVQANDKL